MRFQKLNIAPDMGFTQVGGKGDIVKIENDRMTYN
jgi:hypothetical protein